MQRRFPAGPTRCPRLLLVALVFLGLPAQAADPNPRLQVGLLLEPADATGLPQVSRPEGEGPLGRLEADWSRVEAVEGQHDWSAHALAIEALRGAGYRVVLALRGSNALHGGAPSPSVEGSLDAWLAFVRSAVTRFAGDVLVFEVGEPVTAEGEFQPDVHALVLKQSALAVRAEARTAGASVRIAQGAVEAAALERQEALWARDLSAYVDILPVWIDPRPDGAATAGELRTIFDARLRHPPALAPWVYVREGQGWDAAATAVTALAAGAETALVQGGAALRDLTLPLPQWVASLQGLFDSGFLPAPAGRLSLAYEPAPPPASARILGRFFDEEESATLVVYHAPETGDLGLSSVKLIVDAPTVRNARILDLASGSSTPIGFAAPPSAGGDLGLRIRAAAAPEALVFERPLGSPGLDLPTEEIEVASERGLTAEEIIARYQEVQRVEDHSLERWTARGRVDFHFHLGEGAQTVDVSVESNYFWERGRDLEWEQTDYFFNGNRVKWKNIPEIPQIQPEKVITLPLDLTLDRTYTYRLVGRERVGERPAYVLEFKPAAAEARLSLYRGRIWIDTETFARLKTSLVQNNLAAPVLSNEEVDRYEEQTDAQGRVYRLFSRIEGQQVWNVLGRTFVVERELTFEDYRINPEPAEFEERRSAAYASSHSMLRDTDEGFRYLKREPDGTRVVTDEVETSQLLIGGGAFKDGSVDKVLPLGAVEYFNYDTGKRKIQVNLFFAGVFGAATASKPDLFGSKLDLTAEVGAAAIKFDDKFFGAGREQVEERLQTLGESARIRLGIPAGKFVKFNVVAGLRYAGYALADEAGEALATFNTANPATDVRFIVPQDHLVTIGAVEAVFNRRGWSMALSGSGARRSDWEAWGLFDDTGQSFGKIVGGSFVAGPGEPVEQSYALWDVRMFKEWHLPRFQKLRGEIGYLDGSRLDRFSRYQFAYFGEDRLNGFSGSGVRFDRGTIARVGYSFNLFEVIQLGAAVERAWVEDETSGVGAQSFTGLGVTGNVVGPWKTVLAAGYGRALASDIQELEGEQEFLLLVLKLF